MRILYKTLLLVLLLSSCEKHHDQEFLVKELIDNDSSLNFLMDKYVASKYYKDSIIKTLDVDTLFGKSFSSFKENYFIEKKGIWLDKWYYSRFRDINDVEISVVTLINKKAPNEKIEFYFSFQDNQWRIVDIKPTKY